jgi:hypothetical protein
MGGAAVHAPEVRRERLSRKFSTVSGLRDPHDRSRSAAAVTESDPGDGQ